MGSIVLVAAGLILVAALLRLWWIWAPDRPLEALRDRWAPPPSAFLRLDGMDVHYRDEWPRDDPAPLVLIHGTGSSLHAWDAWAAEFAGRRVVRFDRPGFGLTGPNPTGDYSMSYYAGFVGRFLDARAIRRCVLVGSSSGGRVAWQFAVTDPGRVHALVLVAPAGYPRSTPFPLGLRLAQVPWLTPIFERILPRRLVAANLRATYGDPARVTPALVDRNSELQLRAGNRRALGQTLIQAAARDDSALIRQVAVPTLILWGGRDTVIPPADADRFHADIAGSHLALFPDLGHMPYEEDPTPTARVVVEFLESQTL